MSTSTSRLSYKAHFEILEEALEDPLGGRIRCPDFGAARRLQLELHAARVLDRQDNKQTYEDDHQLHGRSIYDVLRCTIENSTLDDGSEAVYVYIRHTSIGSYAFERLSEVEGTVDGAGEALEPEEETADV